MEVLPLGKKPLTNTLFIYIKSLPSLVTHRIPQSRSKVEDSGEDTSGGSKPVREEKEILTTKG